MKRNETGNAGRHGKAPWLVLLGGGGHCKVLIDVIEMTGSFRIAGYVDLLQKRNEHVLAHSWLGSDEDIPKLALTHTDFIVAAGQIGLPILRERLFSLLTSAGGRSPVIISPHACVSRHASLGGGTVALHGAIVNAKAIIGRNVIINTAAVVEHDATIGDHCHVSTGARVNGDCRVANRCFVGSGAVLREGIALAEGSIIGAGAVVTRDTSSYGVYRGVPARRYRDVAST